MKNIISILSLAFLIIIAGCATSSYSVGRDFSSENIKSIVKGKTKNTELIKLFSQPFSKTVISKNEEKWIYTYSSGTASAQSYLVTTKVETTGNQKTLDILLKDGVVINYTFTENSNPYDISTY